MMDEHDLTDPHGEAEALRKENARLRAERDRFEAALGRACLVGGTTYLIERAEAAEAALAASRVPDPVVKAGSCQPGDLVSRVAVLNIIGRWEKMGLCDLRVGNAIEAIPAAPVACGQTGVRDKHGRMICVGDRIRIDLTNPATKREYWQPEYIVEWKPPAFKLRYVGGDKDSDTAQWRFSTAQPDALEIISQRPPVQPTIGGAELDALVARLDSFDTMGQDVQQEHQRVKPGLYEVFWKSGGSSFAAFGCTANGDNWFAPTNWLRPVMLRDIKPGEWVSIDRIAALTPPPDAELDALVQRLRAKASLEMACWGDDSLYREAADAITALRAQPDWKAMAERLGEAIKARKSARFASQLYEADEQIDAALSDLAKMKGE